MIQTKLHYFLTLLMLFALATVNAVADTTIKTVDFTSWTENTSIADGSTINDCYFKGAGSTVTNSDGVTFNNNMKVNNYYIAIPLTNINGSITVTIEGGNRPSLRYAISSNAGTITEYNDIARPSSGTSVTFTVSNISASATYLCLGRNGSGNTIKTVTVTTPDAESLVSQTINIADLYIEHQVYNPSRSNIAGFNIATSGWQSYTNTSSTPYTYSLLLNESSRNDNAITISTNSDNGARKIKQVVLVGANGNGTFNNTTPSSSDTYSTTETNQIVWRNSAGANSVTINLTATDRPAISAIWVYTDAAMTWSKQNVSIAFSPNSGATSTNSSEVNVAYPTTSPSDFRLDYTFNANGTSATGTQHISGKNYGITPGSTAGTATVTATAPSSTFFNANSTGDTYSLLISDNSLQSKTITIDDMRFSKTANSGGLSATNNLNRTLGGFAFTFDGGDGLKYNNGDGIYLRKRGSSFGKITITPQKNSENSEGTITITRVDIATNAAYTDGTVKVNSGSDIYINNVSSYTFDNLTSETFTIEAQDGTGDKDELYITGITIYYKDPSGVLNTTNVTPTITFSKASDNNVAAGDTYTSPTITTSPANFDISASSNNTNVATVSLTNWANNGTLVSLQGETGSATITASAAESTYFNAAANAQYTVTYTAASAGDKWDFRTLNVANTINATDWTQSGEYYTNNFTTSSRFDVSNSSTYTTTSATGSQIYELLFGRNDNGGLAKGLIELHSSYMTFTKTSIIIAVPVTAGEKVLVTFDGGNGSTQAGFEFGNATLEGDASATQINSDETQTTATLVATADGYVTLKNNKSNVKLYRIQVSNETRGTLDLRDTSNSYEKNVGTGTTASTNAHFNHRVKFSPDGALNYANDASLLHIESTDPTVLDASHAYVAESNFGNSSSFYFNNIIPLKAGTASLIITFDGNNDYKPTSYTSEVYTVYGPTKFLVQVDDQDIQQGQFSLINPIITDTLGHPIGIREMSDGSHRYTTYVLDEEEAIPDYSNYFTFTYTPGTGTGDNYEKITMDGTIANKVLTEDENDVAAAVGATRIITVTATPISNYQSAFSSGSAAVSASATMTIIEKVKNPQFNLYWDESCTDTYKITTIGTDAETGAETWAINSDVAEQASDKQWLINKGVFSSGFPNGRMLYVQVTNPGDSIWFSYGQNEEASTIPANPKVDQNNRSFQYRRGIPIYIDDNLGSSDYITVNIVATTYNASTRKRNLNGSVARLKFPKIIAHTRPAEPTYDPVSPDADPNENKDGRKIMNTSENVVAYGEGASKNVTGRENIVYGKFSTASVYTTEMLINEKNVQRGIDNVPVVSTEVAKRRFTAVQIRNFTASDDAIFGYGDYISGQTYTEYWYLYDTDLRLYTDAAKTTPLTEYNIDTKNASGAITSATPYYTVTWYNKNPEKYQEVDSYDGKMEFAITGMNGFTASDLSIDASTGAVTLAAGSVAKEGWVKVTATYLGGEQHGGVSGEPKYTSTTDESTADFYVYFVNSNNHKPRITPQTRNFANNIIVTVAAPVTWKVKYVIDYSQDANHYTTGTEIMNHGTELAASETTDYTSTVSQTIGSTISDGTTNMAIDATVTVRAVAFDPSNTNNVSNVVSETYTKKAALPDPIFDPNGAKEGGYKYNTNSLTVQIACAYAGSIIYYTIGDSPDIDNPVIGAANTYRYSGLSKVTVTGNKYIKAVAYDPDNGIFSNVVRAYYYYSDKMDKPYFQISDDGGASWFGYNGSTWAQNATGWYDGQSHGVTPSTQIRIVDPNPTKGEIYYTLDGSTPADNSTSLIYEEGNPFTVGKNTTGKAITKLDDASSDVASAVFKITNDSHSYVWEANQYTLTDSVGKRGIHIKDGFVISTNSELKVANTGTTVNSNSLASGNTLNYTFAQEHITATFGGYDLASWEQMTIADAATGAPIGNVGEYSIKNISNTGVGNGNAKDEHGDNYNHVYSYKTTPRDTGDDATPATTHEKTFKVPAIGGYVRFEPEKDGDLTIWCLQQGALLYEDDQYFIDNVLRIRPVYMVDEQGNSLKVKVVNGVPQLWSSARLSENWAKIQATAASNGWKNSKWIGEENDKYDETGEYVQYIRVSDGKLFSTVPSIIRKTKCS